MKKNIWYQLTYASLIVMGIGSFTSVSFSAIGHILLLPPAVFFTIKAAKEGTLTKLPKSSWALWGVVFSIICSVLINWSDMHTPVKAIMKAKYFVLPLLGIYAYRETFEHWMDLKKIKILLGLTLFATTLASVSGLVGMFTGFNPIKFKAACHPSRSCGLFGMYMTYGYGISMYVVLAIVMFFQMKVWKNISPWWALLINAFVNGIGLIASFSRGAWIGSFVGVGAYLFKVNKKYLMTLTALGAIGFGMAYFSSTSVQEMIHGKARKSSSTIRLGLYQAAFYAFKENPVFGKGYRNFEPQSVALKEKYDLPHPEFQGHAHNNFIEHLASTGGVGFIFLVAFHLLWLFESYRKKGVHGKLVFPFVVTFIVTGMFQYTFGDGENVFFIMAIYALSQVDFSKRSYE